VRIRGGESFLISSCTALGCCFCFSSARFFAKLLEIFFSGGKDAEAFGAGNSIYIKD